MNTAQLKTYAPAARRDFIKAVSAQAARLGITDKGATPAELQGDVLLVAGQAFPRTITAAREKLVRRVQDHGFDQTMDATAYTWFNRLVAIRYMELQGYLDHGYRVLSHPEGKPRPEILDHAADVELAGLNRALAIELKLDGTKDEELYRLLLKAQCNALHQAMPFLFERIGDETELLLPANLLNTDSLVRQMVEGIEESAWEHIEITGWLYQFYISEKKDQVIGRVVKSEDIPAATQLFTPNWIVKYMVQNSLGAQWLATYPNSPLRQQMDYYVEPAEQTPAVKAQLKDITPGTLNPEVLTLVDPACGSGHILVEGYELFKAIYLERGYRPRDVARLILENNLFGLDIDERAAQLTGFALTMKGRADDPRLFERGVKLNIMSLVDSIGFEAETLAQSVILADYGLQLSDLIELKRYFQDAKTFGSLIQLPKQLSSKLPALKHLSNETSQDLFVVDALKLLEPLVLQAEMLDKQYDVVVANPPYMGSNGMNPLLKKFGNAKFPDGKSDLFGCFIERGYKFAKGSGYISMVTMQSWMFLSSFQNMRERMLRERTISSMAHMSSGVMGIAFGTAATVIRNCHLKGYVAGYSYTTLDDLTLNRIPVQFPVPNERLRSLDQDEFKKIPGSPVAYWISERVRRMFTEGSSFEENATPRQGLGTTNNDLFVRCWWEIPYEKICFHADDAVEARESRKKWFPYSKGGGFRKWFGNECEVVNWENDGQAIRLALKDKNPNIPRSEKHYFKEGLTWGLITSAEFGARYTAKGAIFDVVGSKAFPPKQSQMALLGLLNSKITKFALKSLNPTKAQVGDLKRIPVVNLAKATLENSGIVSQAVDIAQKDWDAQECSWDFKLLPLLPENTSPSPSLGLRYKTCVASNRQLVTLMNRLEEDNNRLFIDAYGLVEELTPEVPIEQITLTVNPAYRYGGKLNEDEQWTRFRQDTLTQLISYALGCMMGRYSLDEPGLIYANSGNLNFDSARYNKFPADDDGIIPITDTDWFEDDAANRLVEFVSVAWDSAHLEDNLKFLADNLSPNKNESSRDTLRRYLCDSFFKDHLQTYKKRPIYWLFSSGRQKGFQCLVYLHRYNEGTLARMRSEYVIPLLGKMAARLEKLQGDIQVAASTAHQKSLEKERVKLDKQNVELLAFDEKLRHYADRRITLDLDDGVRVNYGKFGDLLAGVKEVQGKEAGEE